MPITLDVSIFAHSVTNQPQCHTHSLYNMVTLTPPLIWSSLKITNRSVQYTVTSRCYELPVELCQPHQILSRSLSPITSDLSLDTGTTVIRPVKSVRVLGVHLDSELTMKTHISKVVSSCYHQLRRIRQVRRLVGQYVAQQLVSAFILSRLDCCNSLLSRLPGSTIQPLHHVMNASARVIMNLPLRDHVKPALKQLHWLPECRLSKE